jgi:DNA-binding NtrC family response regulator
MKPDILKRILIVDDEHSVLLGLSYLLKMPGVEVVACEQIEEAEEELNKRHFDLVITDIRMSGVAGIEGLELLSYVKKRYKTDVIIMTGHGSEEVEKEAYLRGALHFFNKPVDADELMVVVRSCGIPVKAD